jgi:hypothetical protein
LAVIIPTIGRDSLQATLDSVLPQLGSLDRIFVAYDGDGSFSPSVNYTTVWVGSQSESGHHATNCALDLLPSQFTHTWRIDDDDVALPGALETMREHACGVPVFMRMRYGQNHPRSPAGSELWLQPALGLGEIGTPCILAPRGRSRWGSEYSGDFSYARDLVDEHGPAIWVDRVVALINP